MMWLLHFMNASHCNGDMAQLSKDIVESYEAKAALFGYRYGRSAKWFLTYDKTHIVSAAMMDGP